MFPTGKGKQTHNCRQEDTYKGVEISTTDRREGIGSSDVMPGPDLSLGCCRVSGATEPCALKH